MSQPRDDRQDDLFRPPLEEIINFRHLAASGGDRLELPVATIQLGVSGGGPG